MQQYNGDSLLLLVRRSAQRNQIEPNRIGDLNNLLHDLGCILRQTVVSESLLRKGKGEKRTSRRPTLMGP